MINVLIVEDQKMIRQLLESHIASANGYCVASSVERAEDAIEICRTVTVNLILMDIMTNSSMTGLDATRLIKQEYPDTKIIIITFLLDGLALENAHQAGADSMWYKNVGQEELLKVIHRTMDGESVFPDVAPVVNVGYITSDKFTPKEREVIRYVVKNLSYMEIAKKMGVSVDNIKGHLRNIYQKTGCKDKVDLIYSVTDSKFINKDL